MSAKSKLENVDSHKRERRYLEPDERRALLKAAGESRWPERDYCLVLIAIRHGLRCSEIIGLRWEDVKLTAARLFVQRSKDGRNAPHPMQDDEVEAVKAHWKKEGKPDAGPVFRTERTDAKGQYLPFSRDGINKLIERLGQKAGIPWRVFPHSLRHTCGFEMVNIKDEEGRSVNNLRTIQAWLGHKSILSTQVYTALDETAFSGVTWRD
jgi:integrase